ncbi:hypothetical protein Zmor_006414 [Zophobas morio]|uniref:Uncharacterized protein n=1 Tax=Zophobas morio TaxID=2755281 RepID=A0AA38MNH4_9CUCU|nr:hypothetical protein Zmor_006414 [Zophobas morio]
MECSLKNLDEWSATTSLKFSTTKSKCMLFTKQQIQEKPTLKLGNDNLQYVERKKFFGVVFDQHLTWKPHINFLKGTCSKLLNLSNVLTMLSVLSEMLIDKALEWFRKTNHSGILGTTSSRSSVTSTYRVMKKSWRSRL